MTTIARRVLTGDVEAPDVLTGGTPCQAFSVAGLRESLADERGNLTLKFVELADAIDHVRRRAGKPACVILWENVPGVLSTKDNAFGCFLAGLAGEDGALLPPGEKWGDAGAVYGPIRSIAWRTLDAQYFGLAQRRRRVFVVASAREGFDPSQVLFEWEGLRRDSAPSRKTGEDPPSSALRSTDGGSDVDHARGGQLQPVAFGGNRTSGGLESETFIAHALRGEGFDASEDGTGRGIPLVPAVAGTLQAKTASAATGQDAESGLLVPVTFRSDAMREGVAKTPSADANGRVRLRDPGIGMYEGIAPTLDCGAVHGVAHAAPLAFDTTQISSPANRSAPKAGDPCHPLAAGADPPAIAFTSKDYGGDATEDLSPTIRAMNHSGSHANAGGPPAIAFNARQDPDCWQDRTGPLDTDGSTQAVQQRTLVRRLTPEECEALQGFRRAYTQIPWRNKPAEECPDGPRYKALGNSWAVPCARWIGRRIDAAIRKPT
jgi:DNA (cytosine-5)-methyltransferase 1